MTVDCEPYLKGECIHGISGKAKGGCKNYHRKICPKFLKWGDRNDKGCSDGDCSKVHPLVCRKSLDLKCFDRACTHKLHIQKCKRAAKPSFAGPAKQPARKASDQTGGKPHSGPGRAGVPITPWQTQPDQSTLPGN